MVSIADTTLITSGGGHSKSHFCGVTSNDRALSILLMHENGANSRMDDVAPKRMISPAIVTPDGPPDYEGAFLFLVAPSTGAVARQPAADSQSPSG
jgi:hypothetical protein